MADIPGLIEGAAEGTGLGIRFLRHVQRTRLLLHLVDICPLDGDPSAAEAVRTVAGELAKYSDSLAEKPRWLVINKIDTLDPACASRGARRSHRAAGLAAGPCSP